jgi:alpha,alpha-trehalose phosphorylase
MRMWKDSLSFSPRLPAGITRVAFSIIFRGRHLHVEATSKSTTYELREGAALELCHGDDVFTLSADTPSVHKPVVKLSPGPAPTQPPGREPDHRVADAKRKKTDA